MSTHTIAITGDLGEVGAALADTIIIPQLAKLTDQVIAISGPRAPDELLKFWTGFLSAMCGAMCADVGNACTEATMTTLANIARESATQLQGPTH